MSIVIPILVLGGIGAFLGVGLAVASRVFAVQEDPRVEQLVDALPGANCGACGQPGCSGYAKALASGQVEITLCSPGGNATVGAIARILGVEAVSVVETVALVKCAGGRRVAPARSEYYGPMDCRTAVLVSGGNKACRWGCVGFKSCAAACKDDAIGFTEDGLAYVIRSRCIACKACVKACPRDLIEMVPKDRTVHILCSSKDSGKITKAACSVGCIACKLCVRQDKDSFVMDGELARVDYAKGKDVPEAAMQCTPGAIWDAARYPDQIAFLSKESARELLKSDQKAFKEAEKAKKAAAKANADKPEKAEKAEKPAKAEAPAAEEKTE